MQRSKHYHTKQKDLIVDLIKKQPHRFTVEDIHKMTDRQAGITTIYRVVNSLAEEGLVVKTFEDGVTYYRYLEPCNKQNHFYLKCNHCDKLVHVKCDYVEKLARHIARTHNFSPSPEHIIINGTCATCLMQQKGSK